MHLSAHDVDEGARGTVETSKAAAPPTGRSMPASWTMLVRSSARDGPTLDLRTSRSMSADMPSTVASGFDLPRTLARSPRRSRGVLPRWWLCREAIVGRSATQSTATPASRRQGGLWPAPAPSWSAGASGCGDLAGASAARRGGLFGSRRGIVSGLHGGWRRLGIGGCGCSGRLGVI